MTFQIPSELLDLHESIVSSMIEQLGQAYTVYYKPVYTECVNCVANPIGNVSANIFRTGGPVPFPFGAICPICNGEGFKQTQTTDTVQLEVIWEQRKFIDIGQQIKIPDGAVQVKGYMGDLQKLQDMEGIDILGPTNLLGGLYKLWGQPIPQGFRKDKFFLAFLVR